MGVRIWPTVPHSTSPHPDLPPSLLLEPLGSWEPPQASQIPDAAQQQIQGQEQGSLCTLHASASLAPRVAQTCFTAHLQYSEASASNLPWPEESSGLHSQYTQSILHVAICSNLSVVTFRFSMFLLPFNTSVHIVQYQACVHRPNIAVHLKFPLLLSAERWIFVGCHLPRGCGCFGRSRGLAEKQVIPCENCFLTELVVRNTERKKKSMKKGGWFSSGFFYSVPALLALSHFFTLRFSLSLPTQNKFFVHLLAKRVYLLLYPD